MHNQPREPQPYEDCQAKSIQEFGWTSQGMDRGWGQGIKSHHTQTCQGIWLQLLYCRKSTKRWLNDHGVGVLDCPANTPDLNHIENLWGIVKRKMRDTRPNNADELNATVKATWASIPPQQCHTLITSMPRWIEAVIKAKGAPTKYWVHIQ